MLRVTWGYDMGDGFKVDDQIDIRLEAKFEDIVLSRVNLWIILKIEAKTPFRNIPRFGGKIRVEVQVGGEIRVNWT